jgi:preprotein translocase subunit SecD
MGLIINDTLTLDNGLQLTGGYLSFNGGQVVNLEYGVSCGLRATLSQITAPVSNTLNTAPVSNVIVSDPLSNVKYTVSGTYSIWANKQAKDAGKKPVQVSTVYYGITSDQITQPPLALLYQYVQSTIYTNTTVA